MTDTKIPQPWDMIITERCAADARFFERNPASGSFMRPADPGEFWPFSVPDGALVRVVRLAPGVRARQVLDSR